MKYFITTLLLTSSLFSATQLLAQNSYLKDSSAAYVKNSLGECWMTRTLPADEVKCGSMPEEMARKLNESINKKPITPFDDLKDMLEQTANDLTLVEPDPENWSDWVAYFLEVLQIESQESGQSEKFDNMLRSLVKELSLAKTGIIR